MKPFAVLLLPLLLAACSNFNDRWKTESIPSVSDTLAGRWSGEWHSFTGHRGELRAIILPDSAPAAIGPATRTYHATFKAKWGLINTAEYTVDFTATPTSDGESFSGEKDLGVFAGGLYHFTGTLRHDDIQTNYTANLDHGTFTLHRTTR